MKPSLACFFIGARWRVPGSRRLGWRWMVVVGVGGRTAPPPRSHTKTKGFKLWLIKRQVIVCGCVGGGEREGTNSWWLNWWRGSFFSLLGGLELAHRGVPEGGGLQRNQQGHWAKGIFCQGRGGGWTPLYHRPSGPACLSSLTRVSPWLTISLSPFPHLSISMAQYLPVSLSSLEYLHGSLSHCLPFLSTVSPWLTVSLYPCIPASMAHASPSLVF